MSGIEQRVACRAVIVKNGKVLVLREAPAYAGGTQIGRWLCPGGKIEPGEPFADGLKREVWEEVGLEIGGLNLLYAGEWFPVINSQKTQIVGMYFVCSLVPDTSQEVKLSPEHDDYKWVTADEAVALDIVEHDCDAVRKYFKNAASRPKA